MINSNGIYMTYEKLYMLIFIRFISAYVWGASVKHNPQKVGKEHVLMDEDVVQIVKK